jgi:signal recognition particle subunit SRP68
LLTSALPTLESLPSPQADSPPSITISASDAQSLAHLLQGELQRHRALVELSNLTSAPPSPSAASTSTIPLVDRLTVFPPNGAVDLTNLVTYPPKIMPIPAKPLFLDVAWNYIEYPARKVEMGPEAGALNADVVAGNARELTTAQQQQQQKKGWFGFGR